MIHCVARWDDGSFTDKPARDSFCEKTRKLLLLEIRDFHDIAAGVYINDTNLTK